MSYTEKGITPHPDLDCTVHSKHNTPLDHHTTFVSFKCEDMSLTFPRQYVLKAVVLHLSGNDPFTDNEDNEGSEATANEGTGMIS